IHRPGNPHERPDQHVVDQLGEEEAQHEHQRERDHGLDQTRSQLDQMLHQRSLRGLDILVRHDAGLSASAGDNSAERGGSAGSGPAGPSSGADVTRFDGPSASVLPALEGSVMSWPAVTWSLLDSEPAETVLFSAESTEA